jgi:hypothetical protein
LFNHKKDNSGKGKNEVNFIARGDEYDPTLSQSPISAPNSASTPSDDLGADISLVPITALNNPLNLEEKQAKLDRLKAELVAAAKTIITDDKRHKSPNNDATSIGATTDENNPAPVPIPALNLDAALMAAQAEVGLNDGLNDAVRAWSKAWSAAITTKSSAHKAQFIAFNVAVGELQVAQAAEKWAEAWVDDRQNDMAEARVNVRQHQLEVDSRVDAARNVARTTNSAAQEARVAAERAQRAADGAQVALANANTLDAVQIRVALATRFAANAATDYANLAAEDAAVTNAVVDRAQVAQIKAHQMRDTVEEAVPQTTQTRAAATNNVSAASIVRTTRTTIIMAMNQTRAAATNNVSAASIRLNVAGTTRATTILAMKDRRIAVEQAIAARRAAIGEDVYMLVYRLLNVWNCYNNGLNNNNNNTLLT